MSHLPPPLSTLLCAIAAALPLALLCARVPAQARADAEAQAMLRRIDAARGSPNRPVASLRIEGTYRVEFPDPTDPQGKPIVAAEGPFRESFAGNDRARHTSEMGAHGAMEKGTTEAMVWEVDPAIGARVQSGVHAAATRRWFAVLRGASPTELYRSIERAGTESIDGREHVLLKMTPAEGKPDVWFVDAEGRVARIDTALPAPEATDAAFGFDDLMDVQIAFADWRAVDGALYPHRRVLRMGPATVTSVCAKVEPNAAIDDATFAPPAAVRKLEGKPAAKAFGDDGKPNYQIVVRDAQPVASIRVTCRPDEIATTLSKVLPEVMGHLNASGAKMAGPPFSRYHAFGATEIDLEAGIPVAAPITAKGRIVNSELPAGRAVMAWHIGPYEKLGDAHGGLQAFAAAKGLAVRGGPWEVYMTDPGMVPDSSKWKTQLFLPVKD